MPEDKAPEFPAILYLGQVPYTRTYRPPEPAPPPGQNNQGMFTHYPAVINDVRLVVSDRPEGFPDGSIVGIYRLEETKAVIRATQLVSVPQAERRG